MEVKDAKKKKNDKGNYACSLTSGGANERL